MSVLVKSFIPVGVMVSLLTVVGNVYAEKRMAPTEITCETFLTLSEEAKPRVVYWFDGYDAGQQEALIDVEDLERPIDVLVAECKETPKASLWQRIKSHF